MRRWKYLRAGLVAGTIASLTACGPQKRNPVGPSSTGTSTQPIQAASTGPAPQFREVASELGLDFTHNNSKTPRKYLIETMGSGAAFFDYNNDGWQDIVVLNCAQLPGGAPVQGSSIRLYRNEKGKKFTEVTQQVGLNRPGLYAMGVTAGDYDNDGWQDLYITCVLKDSVLFHNVGGKFTDVTKQAGVGNPGMWGTSAAWLDYDKDGYLDLFVCNYVQYRSLKDDQPCRSGDKLVYCIPSAYDPSHCRLYKNNRNGTFKDVSAESGIAGVGSKALGISLYDQDGDGWLDIFVANDTVPGFLFRNLGNGKFEEIGTESGVAYNEEGVPHSGMGIDAADPMGTGSAMLAITNYQGQETSFYSQNGDLFRDDRGSAGVGDVTRKYLGFGTLFFDYDNDGLPDLVQVNGHVQDDIANREPNVSYEQPTLLFRNQGDGKWAEVGLKTGAPFNRSTVGRGVAWGDYDNDGKLDLLITSNHGKLMLWHNATETQNHWIGFKLTGTTNNRDGVGTLVKVTAGGKTQRAFVRTGASYLTQSDMRLHFGLGSATASSAEIIWPSGAIQKLDSLESGRIHAIQEPQGSSR